MTTSTDLLRLAAEIDSFEARIAKLEPSKATTWAEYFKRLTAYSEWGEADSYQWKLPEALIKGMPLKTIKSVLDSEGGQALSGRRWDVVKLPNSKDTWLQIN